jgi:hypothetical protein
MTVHYFIIKPTRCTKLRKFILSWNSTCFGQFLCPLSGIYSLYTQQWCMSYRFVDSSRAGSGCSNLILLSVQWINSWWWTDELSETCRVSCKNKFVKLMHLVGFIIKKFVTMHGHMNVIKRLWNKHIISTRNNFPRQAASRLTGQEFLRLWRNEKFNYIVQKTAKLDPIITTWEQSISSSHTPLISGLILSSHLNKAFINILYLFFDENSVRTCNLWHDYFIC